MLRRQKKGTAWELLTPTENIIKMDLGDVKMLDWYRFAKSGSDGGFLQKKMQ